MRFIPSKYKFKKQQKGKAYNKITILKIPLNQGNIGLRALEHVRLTSKQLTALRNQLRKKLKKKAKIIFPIFPQSCVTSKPAEVRMGKGKGAPSFWVCKIKQGQVLFEMDGIPYPIAQQAALLAYYKLPLKTKFITRD